MHKNGRTERGFALVAVLLLTAMVAALVGTQYLVTRADLATTRSAMDRTRGFYAAEAGLNVRAQQIRDTFEGYNRPAGATPAEVPGQLPCVGAALGSGDYACQSFSFKGRDVRTFVEEPPGNPASILIPPGEAYQNLNAQEYRYGVKSMAVNHETQPEAILEMLFKSRLVPLFQFAVFYNKDLEIYPQPPMTLDGPVHCNGDIYAGGLTSLTITGQVTVSHNEAGLGGRLYNGRKYDDCCSTANVKVFDGAAARSLPTGPGRHLVTNTEQIPWNGWIRTGMEPVTVPPPEDLDPVPGMTYWDKADIRIMYDLNDNAVEVRDAGGAANGALSLALNNCPGTLVGGKAVATVSGNTFRNWRENAWIQMLDVDMRALLNCMHNTNALIGGKALDDATEGGLVFYLGVEGPIPTGTVNNYGVRVRRGTTLSSNVVGAPAIRGLTVVSNQAMYVRGNYNSQPDAWKPAAFLCDSINILSNNWIDGNSNSGIESRVATATKVYAAFLAGTDSTGGVEQNPLTGAGSTAYNGGLENYPRFHENWEIPPKTFTYRGSFVSLNRPRHVHGTWAQQSYKPPPRDWGYDTRFNDAANLPPLSPRFVYLTQELFDREFEY